MIIFLMVSALLSGCTAKMVNQEKNYEGRVFYEIFVRSFNDSNGDGIGDLNGITQKLDYLSKDLGITGIWLMPINTSPSYHGYDITDYYSINKDYGTMDDFKKLIGEAHKRGIKVIMDLVINHTSIEHPWFKEASINKNSEYRNYYIWADKNTDINQLSAMGTQMWRQLGDDYYNAVFWEGMPDLNYDNKDVRNEMKKVAKYYLGMGVDGFRLDAAMHIYDGDHNKNTAWWKEFNDYVKSQNKDAVLVGEVWSDTETIGKYLTSLDSAFNFPLAQDIINSVSSGSMGILSDQIKAIYDSYAGKNSSYLDSPFLTNHDQNRVMSQLNDVNKAKEAAAILLTLPGTPYIYYGEELGMTGQGRDENKREPLIWDNKDTSKNTSWEPVISGDPETAAVNIEINDKNSLLNFYKAMISLRNKNNVLKYGNYQTFITENFNVLAYKRVQDKKVVYVYINAAEDNEKENMEIGSGKVLYSNRRSDKKVKAKNGQIELKPNEILILEK